MPLSSRSLGVVIVTFNAADVILDCLESLLASEGVPPRIVVVDNASTDDTIATIKSWADGSGRYEPPASLPFNVTPVAKPVVMADVTSGRSVDTRVSVELMRAPVNGGFAAGVNRGLAHLARDPAIRRFWVLNPDSVVAPGTAQAFASYEPGPFSIMGGRVSYLDPPDMIQIDGGTLDRRTGVTGNINLGKKTHETPLPDAQTLDFVTGANLVVSREFYESAGPMPEDYFLYYEEVDWALRRNGVPMAVCAEAHVLHRGGSSIGSPTLHRLASPFSLFFKHRGRMRFMRRHFPRNVPAAWLYTAAKAGQYVAKGYFSGASAILQGALDRPLPQKIRRRLGPDAAAVADRKGDN
jgi:GT2 family glycosyltransferase